MFVLWKRGAKNHRFAKFDVDEFSWFEFNTREMRVAVS